jgi:hypothetical protein
MWWFPRNREEALKTTRVFKAFFARFSDKTPSKIWPRCPRSDKALAW